MPASISDTPIPCSCWLAAFADQEEFGIRLKDRYRLCDTFGVDFLGPHNLHTHFHDFDSTDGDRVLSRRDDFERYLGVLARPLVAMSNGLCFLKSPTPLAQMAMGRFQQIDFGVLRASRLKSFAAGAWLHGTHARDGHKAAS